MSEEIKIGGYVRTRQGYILKNTYKDHKNIIDNYDEHIYSFRKIVKHSKNIIDLIEVRRCIRNIFST